MPGEDIFGPAVAQVNLLDCVPENEHAVVMTKIVAAHLLGRTNRAVMGIVEKEQILTARNPVATDASDQRRIVPFVDDHQIGVSKSFVEIQRGGIVKDAVQMRIRGMKVSDGEITMFA